MTEAIPAAPLILPASLSDVADLCGGAVALALYAAYAGTRVYVPQAVAEGHPLAVTLGLDAARSLAERIGGQAIDVPTGLLSSFVAEAAKRREIVVTMSADGKTVAEMARAAGCTERRVFQILASRSVLRVDSNQLDLLDYISKAP